MSESQLCVQAGIFMLLPNLDFCQIEEQYFVYVQKAKHVLEHGIEVQDMTANLMKYKCKFL